MDQPARPIPGPTDAAPAPVRLLAALLAAEADLDALERMIAAWAVHADGGGAAHAWWLKWDARAAVLTLARESAAAPDAPTLVDWLGQARRAAPEHVPADQRRLPWGIAPAALAPGLAEVWHDATVASGVHGGGDGTPWSDTAGLGAIALRRGPRPHGLLVLAGGAPSRQGLAAFQEAASLALESQLRTAETRRRARQATAAAEFARTVVSAVNVAEALHLLARLAAQGAGARGAAVFRRTREDALELAVAHGPSALREPFAAAFREAAEMVCRHGQPLSGDRGSECPGIEPGVAGETSVWAVLPIRAYGHSLGALVVHDGLDRGSPGFERGELEHLTALADHAALLLEHAARLARQEGLERSTREHGTRASELEARATLGDLAARIAEECRNPLASIGAFARRALREDEAGESSRESVEIVAREAERLESLLAEQTRWSGLERPRLRMQSLNAIVQESLQRSSEVLVRRRVRLIKKLAPDLPDLLLDAPRIQRVVQNVLAHALESAPLGGRIRVESRRAGAFVVVELAHDGSRQTTDVLDQLFVPFAPGATGAALGLGMAHQVVREHGGEVRVRTEGEWGAVVSFTLPVAENSDRRNRGERRSVRTDRRRRGPEAASG